MLKYRHIAMQLFIILSIVNSGFANNLGGKIVRAGWEGNLEMVRTLIEDDGVDPDIEEELNIHGEIDKYTVLLSACESYLIKRNYNSREILKYLVSKGANINFRNRYGSCLISSTKHNNFEAVKLLVELGADVNITSTLPGSDSTPKKIALEYGYTNIYKYLSAIEKNNN